MRLNTLFFLLTISCLSLALAQVTYDDCCLKYVKQMNHKTQKHAVDYRMQLTDGSCNIPAVIFTMRKKRVFCTDPKEAWVQKLMKKIDAKKFQKASKDQHNPRRPNRG
ncbi:C-C motif chemokine 25 [Collichthys lucidus]|uniref:C-C motif chemokine 25 n=1 Tax=Collichthys lucidus TaxID=240159 RepID=A0A4U5UW90_COLLU|nr:C-C motif chemokine 25 [Collichthys lucidus]